MYVTGFEVTRQVACYARRLMFRNIKFVYSKCNISKALSYMLKIYAMNVTRFAKGSYTCTVSRYTFYHHLIATSMDQQHMYLILLKVEQFA